MRREWKLGREFIVDNAEQRIKGLITRAGMAQLAELKFRLLRFPDIFLRPCLVKQKRGNLEVYIVYIYICA